MGVSMVQWCTVSMIDDVWAHAFKRNPSANERIYSGIWRVQLLFAWTAISNANNNYGCLSNIELRIKLVEIPKNKFFFSIKIVAFDRFILSANLFILHWKHTPHRCVWGKNWVLKSLIADVAEIKSTQISSNKHLCLQSIMLFMYYFLFHSGSSIAIAHTMDARQFDYGLPHCSNRRIIGNPRTHTHNARHYSMHDHNNIRAANNAKMWSVIRAIHCKQIEIPPVVAFFSQSLSLAPFLLLHSFHLSPFYIWRRLHTKPLITTEAKKYEYSRMIRK